MTKRLILLLCLLFAFQFSAFDVQAGKPCPGLAAGSDLLQFASAGHILGFAPDRVYMAGMGYLLTEEFVGAKGVTPVSVGSQAQKDTITKGAPELEKVSYPNLWQGITLYYEEIQGGLTQSTYFISPGADVSQIKLRYNAAAKIQDNGSLRFTHPTEKGYFTMTAPIAWQEIEGEKVKVEVAFHQIKDDVIGFAVGRYDDQYPLSIDPTYEWHTFHGSIYVDRGYAIAVDASGNVYVTGASLASWGSPLHAHAGGENHDIVIIKLNSSGVRQWHTFYGAINSDDIGYGIAVDSSGNVYVAGTSYNGWGSPVNNHSSPGGPGVGDEDIVVLKLNSAGGLVWNTFHGIINSNDYGYGLAIDTSGNAYVTGSSNLNWGSPVNPNSGGTNNSDIVVLKLNTSGVLQWNTFHGSSTGSAQTEQGNGIAVDTGGNVYVTGISPYTWGSPVNPHSGNFEIVVLKLNSAGVLQWNTFHGSSSYDYGQGIAVADGDIYVTGNSYAAWGSPVNAFSGNIDIVVLKLNSSTGVRQWHTFQGSADQGDYGYGIAVHNGGVYAAGYSDTTWGSPENDHAGGTDWDIVVFKLGSGTGGLEWNTFHGSTSGDIGYGIASHTDGSLYVAGVSYASWVGPSSTAPVNSYTGGQDIVVLKLSDQANPGQYTLTVNKTGAGTGTVTSSPVGIDCGSACSFDYDPETVVTLTASPTPGSVFAGWSGATTGTEAEVQVTMDAAKTITARFNLEGTGTAIPTMTEWGMIIMSLILAGSAIWMIRRRQTL